MLSRAQRNRRPVAFRSADVLGGSQVVVPAGTVVRLPAAPGSLEFMGYNTLSLKATLAGMAGADRFAISVDTLDPESAAGARIASSRGVAPVIVGAFNGNVAGTLGLRGVLAGAAGTVYLPNSDITPVGTEWGTNSGAGGLPSPFVTTWENVATIDDLASYMTRDGITPGIYNYVMGLNGVLSPAVTAWGVTFRGARLFGFPITNSSPPTHGFKMYIVTSDGTRWQSALFDAARFLDAFQTFTLPMSIQGTGDPNPNSIRVALGCGPGGAVCYTILTYINAFSIASGLTTSAIPFYRNVLLLDATASASDVTVSALVAELTNA